MAYQITYTNLKTGQRESYMNIGFDTRTEAKEEIKCLLSAKLDYKKRGIRIDNFDASPVALIGFNFRIKKIKFSLKLRS